MTFGGSQETKALKTINYQNYCLLQYNNDRYLESPSFPGVRGAPKSAFSITNACCSTAIGKYIILFGKSKLLGSPKICVLISGSSHSSFTQETTFPKGQNSFIFIPWFSSSHPTRRSQLWLRSNAILYTVWRSLGYLKCVGLLMKFWKCRPAGLELTTQQQLCQNSSPI